MFISELSLNSVLSAVRNSTYIVIMCEDFSEIYRGYKRYYVDVTDYNIKSITPALCADNFDVRLVIVVYRGA